MTTLKITSAAEPCTPTRHIIPIGQGIFNLFHEHTAAILKMAAILKLAAILAILKIPSTAEVVRPQGTCVYQKYEPNRSKFIRVILRQWHMTAILQTTAILGPAAIFKFPSTAEVIHPQGTCVYYISPIGQSKLELGIFSTYRF